MTTAANRPGEGELSLVTVYESGAPGRIAIARSLLDGEGIRYIVLHELIQDLNGYGRMWTGYNYVFGPVLFRVRAEDAYRARELLADLPATAPPAPSRFMRCLAVLFALSALAQMVYGVWVELQQLLH